MFAYCLNNPVNYYDPTGYLSLANDLLQSRFMLSGPGRTKIKVIPVPPIPAGGETVFSGQVRICTDGSNGELVADKSWCPETALSHNDQPLDAYTICYVVAPMDAGRDILGCSALLINHDTGMYVWCVVGDRGPSENGWGEVSICAIWDTGNPQHNTANSAYGLGSNYEIILYRDREYLFDN